MFSNLTQTLLFPDKCIVALNPPNATHQQSNICFRIRLDKKEDIHELIEKTRSLFEQSSLVPHYFIDELCGVELEDVQKELAEKWNISASIDSDLIMSWKQSNNNDMEPSVRDEIKLTPLGQESLESLVQVFAAANSYGDDVDWLRKKIGNQLIKKDVYTVFGAVDSATGEVLSGVIVNNPPGLKHIAHINAVATHPKHQGKGLAGDVLRYALSSTCKENDTFYLEVYDDLYHAHRLYEKVGFKKEGIHRSITILFP